MKSSLLALIAAMIGASTAIANAADVHLICEGVGESTYGSLTPGDKSKETRLPKTETITVAFKKRWLGWSHSLSFDCSTLYKLNVNDTKIEVQCGDALFSSSKFSHYASLEINRVTAEFSFAKSDSVANEYYMGLSIRGKCQPAEAKF